MSPHCQCSPVGPPPDNKTRDGLPGGFEGQAQGLVRLPDWSAENGADFFRRLIQRFLGRHLARQCPLDCILDRL